VPAGPVPFALRGAFTHQLWSSSPSGFLTQRDVDAVVRWVKFRARIKSNALSASMIVAALKFGLQRHQHIW
jgi:hypothetical protein